MATLSETFARLSSKGEKALVTFVTAGDPSLEALPDVLDALCEGGADVIELGIPFSDPIADGPTIQASSQRALEKGVTPQAVLDALHEWRLRSNSSVPIVLMGYYNPLLRIGLEKFAQAASQAGANATIISDLTPEEASPWLHASQKHGLENVFLAAPTSTDARLRAVAERSTGFLYAVARTGVTGATTVVGNDGLGLVQRLKAMTHTPVCMGFGISKPEHVRDVVKFADGAVVGSHLVNLLSETWDSQGAGPLIKTLRDLKAATE